MSIDSGNLVRVAKASSTWTLETSQTTNDFYGVGYGNGEFIGVGLSGMTDDSTDAVTWASSSNSCTNGLGIAYGAGKWVDACDDGNIFLSSDGGASWQTGNSSVSGTQLSAVAYGGSLFVAVGNNDTIITSSNGSSWSSSKYSGTDLLNGVTYGGGKFVAVGNNNAILTSTDGNTWTPQAVPAGVNQNFMGVTYANNQFVAVGTAGTIITSSNGVSWTKQTSGTTYDLYGVAYGAGKMAAVGDQGTIIISTDGVSWAAESSGTSTIFYNITYGAGKFIAVGATGLLDEEQVASTNANLSGLTLSSGTLSPSFASTTTSYTASVGNSTTSVNVTPTVADSTATVTVNGSTVSSGSPKSVALNVGANTITVVVTAQDGTTQKTYTATITRAPSSNANLSNLTLSAGTLSPVFASGTTSYTASVANAVTSVNVTPTLADSTATLKVNGNAATSGNASNVPLNVGANTITVLVTAQDGTTQKTYTVTVTRAQSNNADLSNLALSAGTLSPVFASGTTSYTASVANGVTGVNVTPTVADSNATVTVDGNPATSGNASNVSLNVGSNTITVVVTAQDGTTTKTYTVTVTRAQSSNADLSNLTLSTGTLNPVFAAGTTSYTASVANAVTDVDVTPTVADSNATVKVNGNAVTSGNAENVALNVGSNTITVDVTAQDGTVKTYTVTVTRQSNNADLSNLTVSAGTLSPVFATGTTSYTASVANAVTSVDVTPTVADSTATVKVNGNAVTSGNAANVALNVGSNTITIAVTAQDGTPKTYTITITRAPSSNADLSNLTLSAGTLSPVFATGTTSYTASVANAVTSVDVTPTVAESNATVTVNGNAATSGNASNVPLIVGSNTITVLVTAQDGTTTGTYTITITRAPSSNADLSNLTLSAGTLSPVFASGTTSYTANVANAVTSVDVTPTVAESNATVKVNGNAVTSGNAANVALNVGSNTITINVTAQDGTTQSYTITVTRAQSSNADLSDLTLSTGTLNPVFASGTTSYTAYVANAVTSVDVTPTVADSTATVQVNGNAVTSGNAANVALNVGSNTITIGVTAQDGTVKTYTVTVTRQSNNADLSNLTLSAGTLSPVFATGTTSYTASVANAVTSVDVTPTVADSTATVKVNGNAVTSGNAANVALNVGSNTITIAVTAQDGTPQTYTITITRAPSSNADLSNLTLSAGTLSPVFASGTTTYTASVANGVTSVDVTPTVAESNATVTVNGNAATSGNASNVLLNVGANTITVLVTAQDGTTTGTYTITITRAPSSNADLSNLTLSAGTLSPVFATGTTSYTASVANAVTSVDVTPTVAESNATVKVNGNAVTSGNAANVALNVGSNTITVLVTAQDGTTTQTYTITVTRAPSSNADLSDLTLSTGTLNPVFASGTTSYTATVANAASSVDVTPTVADSTATVQVNGNAVTSGNAANIALNVGSNTITIGVTAQDGTVKTYTVTVTRQSNNADLSNLTLSAGTLSPVFASGTTSYTASVANAVTGVDVTPTVADSTATVKVNGNAVTSGNAANVALNVGSNTITIDVTAQDGTPKTYTITITRAPSSNADLSSLTLSAGTLSPVFASGTTSYTASVANGVSSVNVTPTVADSTATVQVNGNAVTSGNAANVALNVGSNTITIDVTAQDGTTQTYTITITRALSSNDDLSNLTVSAGTLSPAFAVGTTSYTVSVENSVTSENITATVEDSHATLTINGVAATSGTAITLALKEGANQFDIVVTAQDGTQKTYTVKVIRKGKVVPPPPPTGGLSGTVHGNPNGNGNGNDSVTQLLGSNVTMSGQIYNANGQLVSADVKVDANGNFTINGTIPPGTYQMVLQVNGPNGEQLAGQTATLTVTSAGQVSVKSDLIDPFGTVRDAVTNQPVDGVKVSLYWADTALNRSQGRTPGTLVQLPELVGMAPNQNHNFQITVDGGKYGWMVFPQGDYYIIAEKDGFETYDSRNDTRDEQQGDTSYIRDGIIHVGETVVQMNFNLQPQVVGEGTHAPYIFGTPDGTFQPDQAITRAQLAAILARILPADSDAPTGSPFSDVSSSNWAAKAIAEVYKQHLMTGYPDGKFHPNDPVTRAQMAVILAKWKQLPTGQNNIFSDIDGHWAQTAILQAEGAGYVSGFPDGTFRPNDPLTRAQAVVILNKVLGWHTHNVVGSAKWSDVPSSYWAYNDIMEASVEHQYQLLGDGFEIWQ